MKSNKTLQEIGLEYGTDKATHQLKSLELLWCKLKPNGYYVIEDLHTSFLKGYIDTEFTTYNFLKKEITPENLKLIKNNMTDLEIFQRK